MKVTSIITLVLIYTDMPNKHSVFDVDALGFDDGILAEYGNLLIMAHPTLFGLSNKNLLKSVTDSEGYTLSYTYELDEDGYPIKITKPRKRTNMILVAQKFTL